MSRYYLKQLGIEGFRGINNHADPLVLKFKPDCVNSIHGHNGVGKSSIFEALYYAIYGFLPRLRDLQDAEQGDSYITNKFHPGLTSTIKMTFEADDGSPDVQITVSRDSAGSRTATSDTGYADPEGFLRSLQEDFVLVDYARFSKFVDTSALLRGRSFSSLVGLSAYSSMRQALEGAKHTQTLNADLGIPALETEINGDARQQADRSRRALAAYTEVVGESRNDLGDLDELKSRAKAALEEIGPIAELVAASDLMTLDFEAAEKAIEAAEGGEGRQRLARLSEARTALDQLAVSEDDHLEFVSLVEKANDRDRAVEKVGSSALLSLLRDASALIGTPDWPSDAHCPVCELEQPASLKRRLTEQIDLYAAATAMDDELTSLLKAGGCFQKLNYLETAAAMDVAVEERVCPAITQALQEGSASTAQLVAAQERLRILDSARVEKQECLSKEIAELEATLPPSLVAASKILSAAKVLRSELQALASAAIPLKQKQSRLEKLKRWKTFIGQAAGLMATAENALANERLSEIQTDYQALFAKLVRGGPDVKPTLDRAPATEQVDLKLEDFFGLTGLSARALLSESYRNAVAAAIFLTAAVKYSRPPRFMVLDDVTSSFDGGHQFELMEALRQQLQQPANPDGIQFIVLSHDTALEKYFDSLGGTSTWHHQKLQGLPPKGRIMVNSQEGERLKTQAEHHLNAGQVDVGAPLVRQYMEYKLGQIISRLQIPVPPDYVTRGDKRTLSTYLGAIKSAVDLYSRAGTCVLDTQQIADLQNTHVASIMSNFVSHYETGTGTPFGAYPLLGVLASIDNLYDCFTYADPGPPPSRKLYKRLDRRS